MQKSKFKPIIVQTAYSARTILWSLALIALFGSLMWAYCAYDSLVRARSRLGEPVPTTVAMPLYSVTLPPHWESYAKDGNTLAVFRSRSSDMPLMFFEARRDPGYPYHAIDTNPAIALKIVEDGIEAAPIKSKPSILTLNVVGSELLTVKPGISAVHLLFDADDHVGAADVFFTGDVRYVIWALWTDSDTETADEVREFFRHIFENMKIPEQRESIDRPVVDSGRLTAEINAATQLQVGREFALWSLFAARVDSEPEAALLPALKHYREALRLLSSIRQERVALASEDFKLYQKFLGMRRKEVAEWFVVLDKAVAMRDWTRARSQAKWIMSHATLTGERVDVRRAAEILATKIPQEGEKK